jgi:hypothetical protein
MSIVLNTAILDKNPELTADGRFFNGPTQESDFSMYGFSQGILINNHHLLPDRRGLLIQFGIDESGQSADLRCEDFKPSLVVSLGFDGSRASMREFRWEMTIAKPGSGRQEYKLVSDSVGTDAYCTSYDTQGRTFLENPTKLERPDPVIDAVVSIIGSEEFKTRQEELSDKKTKAEEALGAYFMELVQDDYASTKISKLITEKQAGINSVGFGVISPIT